MSLDLGDHPQLMAFLTRAYSPSITNYIIGRLPPDGVFFDVGGNVGLVSFAVAARRPDVTVHAFEPDPRNAEAWKRNQQLNPAASARLMEMGVSDHEGAESFVFGDDSGAGRLDASGTEKVEVTTLDAYSAHNGVEQVDVLKIDVQGHEPAVLRGAARLLSSGAIRTVVMEICEPLLALTGDDANSIIRPLEEEHGFRVLRIRESGIRRLRPDVRRQPAADLAFEL